MHALHGQTAKPLPPCAYATPPSAVVRLPTSAGACACATAQAVNGEMLLLDALTPCGGGNQCAIRRRPRRRGTGAANPPGCLSASLLATRCDAFRERLAHDGDAPLPLQSVAAVAVGRAHCPACALSRLGSAAECMRACGAHSERRPYVVDGVQCGGRERGRPGTGVLLRAFHGRWRQHDFSPEEQRLRAADGQPAPRLHALRQHPLGVSRHLPGPSDPGNGPAPLALHTHRGPSRAPPRRRYPSRTGRKSCAQSSTHEATTLRPHTREATHLSDANPYWSPRTQVCAV